MPDAMLLICPVLNLMRSPSPSRITFGADTILPLLSPAFASDEVLRRLPPTNIQVGSRKECT